MCCLACLKQPSLFPSPLTKHTLAAQPVTSSRKPSLHPASFSFPVEVHAYHLCSSQAPCALDLECWLIWSSFSSRPVLNQEPHQLKNVSLDPMNIFIFIYKLYASTAIQI